MFSKKILTGELFFTFFTVSISAVALVVSAIALYFTARIYFLKRGANIRGFYSIASSIACEDKYVCNVTLENIKDRSIAIFKVYLLLGHNYFLEIDDFEADPLILGPFEIFNRAYEPIDFYSVCTKFITINNLIDNKKVKKRLVLSTSEGKYLVKDYIPIWNPIATFFKNHLTAIIQPARSTYKGKAYGGNAMYIVEFNQNDGSKNVSAIYPGDYRIKKFRHFQLTREALESTEALGAFFDERIKDGTIKCADVKVYEMDSWREKEYEMYSKQTIEATYFSWFKYYVAGRLLTISETRRLNKKNTKARHDSAEK